MKPTTWKTITRTLCAAALASQSASAVSVFVDFGQANATGNWNGISDAVAGSVADAIDSTGAATGISVAITSRFGGTNTNGTTDPAAPYPSFATGDSFYGNADAAFSGVDPFPSSTIEITGLALGTPYDFTFFGSRMGVADNRESSFSLTGTNAGFAELDVSNNEFNTATINGIVPDGTGMITVVVGEGDDNNNGTGFFYLGAMEFATPIPEPDTAWFLLGSVTLLALRRRR